MRELSYHGNVHPNSSSLGVSTISPCTRSADGTDGVNFDTATVLRMLGEMMEEGASGDEVMSDSGDSGEEEMREIMEEMDQQLKASGFKSSLTPGVGQDSGQDDLHLAQNLLSSLSVQPEAAGPASNILHSLGIPVPDQNGTQTDSSLPTS